MTEFSTRIKVRHYELDTLGHVNHAVYHQYAEVARLEWLQAHADGNDWTTSPIRAVLLESHIRFKRELRAGDVVDVTCTVEFGDRKVFNMDSVITKADGTVSATIECVLGMMDLRERKLVNDPKTVFKELGFEL